MSRKPDALSESAWSPRPTPVRLALAILLPFLACGVQFLLWDYLEPRLWFFFYPALIASVILGGLRGGVAATLLSAGLSVWLFMEPRYTLKFTHMSDGLGLLEFLVMGIGLPRPMAASPAASGARGWGYQSASAWWNSWAVRLASTVPKAQAAPSG